jgi:hypothetical protein
VQIPSKLESKARVAQWVCEQVRAQSQEIISNAENSAEDMPRNTLSPTHSRSRVPT